MLSLAAPAGTDCDCWWAEPQSNRLDQPKGPSSPQPLSETGQ